MQPPKPIRTPLTIVGIITNVLALTLVCVLLYEGNGAKLPTLIQVADFIREIAKSRNVKPVDLVAFLGNFKSNREVNTFSYGHWEGIKDANTESVDIQYTVVIYAAGAEENTYLIWIAIRHTYKRGIKYFFENIARASRGGSLFPLQAIEENESETLLLPLRK